MVDIPGLNDQNFSDKTLKGFLLKNVDPNPANVHIQNLNKYLIDRVDNFWKDVVIPLRNMNRFDGNKINWYFEIYREGLESQKLIDNPFNYLQSDEQKFEELVSFLSGKSLLEYLTLGTSFLTNTFAFLTSRVRDTMMLKRKEIIYVSNEPVNWIIKAEEEEHGLMTNCYGDDKRVQQIINNISLIIARKV